MIYFDIFLDLGFQMSPTHQLIQGIFFIISGRQYIKPIVYNFQGFILSKTSTIKNVI